MRRFGPSLAGVLLAALVWTLAAKAAGPLLLPSPTAVLGSLWQDQSRLFVAAQQTTLAALAGLGIAALVGLATATASFSSRTVGALLSPWLLALQVVPIVAIAPLLVVWLGYGLPVAMTTAFIASVFPVHAAGRSGLLSINDSGGISMICSTDQVPERSQTRGIEGTNSSREIRMPR